MDKTKNRKVNLAGLAVLILVMVSVGTLGFMLIEGWNFLDAFYMVVITLATVGFREVHELSPSGTIFTILLIVFGLVTLYYVLRLLGEYVIEDKLEENLESRKLEKTLKNLSDHYIIAGFGRVGRQIALELAKEGVSFVVIEKNLESFERCKRAGYLCLMGDSTEEETLKRAGTMDAKTIIVALGRDSDAVLTIITAKSLNNDIFIVARANQGSSPAKLSKIGANRVVLPHQIGAFRMANFALNPTVADFLDDVQDLANSEVEIDDVIVAESSVVAGHSIADRLSNRTYGATVLAIHKPDGNAIINPVGDAIIEAGDRLILLGTKSKLARVVQILEGKVNA
ncbi:potassium channel protein [candidate division Kazan bacterium]|uniref:Potassium channel protein n=1 Tax=candidate division Kazan bacterium TaxID=2202143 RepID=A0A420ZCU6_UNCK3|nr:MAG: potassium channel protein [candidate division Kazan bacterium]